MDNNNNNNNNNNNDLNQIINVKPITNNFSNTDINTNNNIDQVNNSINNNISQSQQIASNNSNNNIINENNEVTNNNVSQSQEVVSNNSNNNIINQNNDVTNNNVFQSKEAVSNNNNNNKLYIIIGIIVLLVGIVLFILLGKGNKVEIGSLDHPANMNQQLNVNKKDLDFNIKVVEFNKNTPVKYILTPLNIPAIKIELTNNSNKDLSLYDLLFVLVDSDNNTLSSQTNIFETAEYEKINKSIKKNETASGYIFFNVLIETETGEYEEYNIDDISKLKIMTATSDYYINLK